MEESDDGQPRSPKQTKSLRFRFLALPLQQLSYANETVIFSFTKTPPTLNFKLLPANH